MLSGILKSKKAIEVNIRIMRAFIKLRKAVQINTDYTLLKEKVRSIESQVMVDSMLIEKKFAKIGAAIRRISEANMTRMTFLRINFMRNMGSNLL